MAWIRLATTGIAVTVCLAIGSLVAGFVVDWAWFSDLGYVDVFWTALGAKTAVFLIALTASSALLWLNGALALGYAKFDSTARSLAVVRTHGLPPWTAPASIIAHGHMRILVAVTAVTLGVLIALGEVRNWDVLLRFVFQVPHGNSDPVFGRDLGFYLFSLPAYVVVRNWLFLTTIFSALLAMGIYWLHGGIRFDHRQPYVTETALCHGS